MQNPVRTSAARDYASRLHPHVQHRKLTVKQPKAFLSPSGHSVWRTELAHLETLRMYPSCFFPLEASGLSLWVKFSSFSSSPPSMSISVLEFLPSMQAPTALD